MTHLHESLSHIGRLLPIVHVCPEGCQGRHNEKCERNSQSAPIEGHFGISWINNEENFSGTTAIRFHSLCPRRRSLSYRMRYGQRHWFWLPGCALWFVDQVYYLLLYQILLRGIIKQSLSLNQVDHIPGHYYYLEAPNLIKLIKMLRYCSRNRDKPIQPVNIVRWRAS